MNSSPQKPKPRVIDQITQDVYSKYKSSENFVFSPACTYYALLDAALSVSDEKREFFKGILQFDTLEELTTKKQYLMNHLASIPDQGQTVEYLAKLLQNQEDVNEYVLEHTGGKLKQYFSNSFKANNTLISAFHFRCEWRNKFKAENTKMDKFHLEYEEMGKQVDVEMMVLSEKMVFNASMDCKLVQIPYNGNAFFMNILLPFETLAKFEKSFNKNTLNQLTSCSQTIKVNFSFPKFKILQTEPLDIKDCFDVCGKIGLEQFTIKTNIRVNEKGTEGIDVGHEVKHEKFCCKPIDFDMSCNKPFIYIITDSDNHIVLMGRVTNPLKH